MKFLTDKMRMEKMVSIRLKSLETIVSVNTQLYASGNRTDQIDQKYSGQEWKFSTVAEDKKIASIFQQINYAWLISWLKHY